MSLETNCLPVTILYLELVATLLVRSCSAFNIVPPEIWVDRFKKIRAA